MIIPKNKSNPVSTTRILKSAKKDTQQRFKKINKEIRMLIESIPKRRVDSDSGQPVGNVSRGTIFTNSVIYEYLLDAFQLQQINIQMEEIIRRNLQNEFLQWYLNDYVDRSYAQGTAQSVLNLESIAGTSYPRTIESVLSSQAYRDRIAFTMSRVFEEMDNLTSSMRTDLGRTLGQAMAAGDNPRNVAKKISKRIGVSESRALTIARTEINQAHRRARWEEAQSASESLGITTKMLHLSALSPTTRTTHARRHGNVYTRKEIEDWYQLDGNAINCKCTQVEILVDSKGNPIDETLIKRTKEDGKEYFETYGSGKKRAA